MEDPSRLFSCVTNCGWVGRRGSQRRGESAKVPACRVTRGYRGKVDTGCRLDHRSGGKLDTRPRAAAEPTSLNAAVRRRPAADRNNVLTNYTQTPDGSQRALEPRSANSA